MEDAFPLSSVANSKTNEVVYAILSTSNNNRAYIDLTVRLTHTSSRGNQYILVGYHQDGNAILAEPLKRRTAGEFKKEWEIINENFAHAGVQPNTYVIDNEASLELKNAMKKRNITDQLVPPNFHRANSAERAI